MRPEPRQPAISRRKFMTASLAAGGAGLALSDVLRLRALGAEQGKVPPDTSVIQIWLGGGPSQFETFDPKPDAPIEFRGPYQSIQTKLPGVQVCEKMPLTAAVLDKTAIVRSFTHPFDDHFGVARWCLQGRKEPDNKDAYPCVGSIASKFRGARRPGMPPYVPLSEDPVNHFHLFDSNGPGYLGVSHSPFTVMQDGYVSPFQYDRLKKAVGNLELANDVTLERVNHRKSLLAEFDRLPRQLDASGARNGLDPIVDLALEMVTSARAKRAFDLNEESAATRDRYGSHRWGQMALMARRLVEAGVTFVTINTAPDCLRWDWHVSLTNEGRVEEGAAGANNGMDVNGPPLDQALSALITDLSQRDESRNVLLIVWGEFGRSPRVNVVGGRDHWPPLGSVLLSGASLKMGQIIGASTSRGEIPADRPVSPGDMVATLYRHLGIDTAENTVNLLGRPIQVLPDGKAVDELF